MRTGGVYKMKADLLLGKTITGYELKGYEEIKDGSPSFIRKVVFSLNDGTTVEIEAQETHPPSVYMTISENVAEGATLP